MKRPEHTSEMPREKISEIEKHENLQKTKDDGFNGDWVVEARGALLVVATVIFSIAFQCTISPLGGLWQSETTEVEACGGKTCKIGKSVIANTQRTRFIGFYFFNNISYSISIAVVALLVSRISLHNQFVVVFISIGICINLISLSIEYVLSLQQINPDEVFNEGYALLIVPIYFIISIILIVFLYHFTRFAGTVLQRIRGK